jgi:hypothetical protein
MGAEPRPIESLRHGVVRDYLVDRMRKLGLEVRVQKGQAVEERTYNGQTGAEGAYVENLIGVLPGQDRAAKSLALMAHYDSVPGSPGAADDAAGTASGLEIMRALIATGRKPARDVDLILTDGEEAGLIGARAFFADDPLAKQIGAVLNMEARGSGGRTFMFETAKDNGEMVDLFRRTAVNPTANSLAVFIYEHMPNDTDFTISKHLGIQGLNFAFIGRQFDYHSPTAIPAHTEPGSIQHMGEQVLSAASALAFAKTLPAAAPSRVFADLYGLLVVSYPPVVGWLILAAAIALAVFGVVSLRGRGESFSLVDFARANAAAFALLLFLAALFSLARAGTGVPHGFVQEFPLLARFNLFEAALGALALGSALIAIGGLTEGRRRLWALAIPLVVGALDWTVGHWAAGAGLAAAAGVLAFFAYGKAVSPLSAAAGFLAAGFGLALIAQALAPPTAFLFTWPLAAVSLALAISALAGGLDRPGALAVNTIAGVLALGWLLLELHGVALGVGAAIPEALSVIAWLCALAVIPLLAVTPGATRWGALAMIVGAVLIAVIFVEKGTFTARHPRATDVMYVHDADTGKYWRVSLMDQLDPWSEQVLKADEGKIEKRMMPQLRDKPVFAALAAPAGPKNQPAPSTFMDVTQTSSDAALIHSTGEFATNPREPLPFVGLGHLNNVMSSITIYGPHSLQPSRTLLGIRTTFPSPKVTVNDSPVGLLKKAGGWSHFVWSQPEAPWPARIPLIVRVATPGHGSAEVGYAVITPSWPSDAKPLPVRPKEAMAWSLSDSTVEIGTIKQSW